MHRFPLKKLLLKCVLYNKAVKEKLLGSWNRYWRWAQRYQWDFTGTGREKWRERVCMAAPAATLSGSTSTYQGSYPDTLPCCWQGKGKRYGRGSREEQSCGCLLLSFPVNSLDQPSEKWLSKASSKSGWGCQGVRMLSFLGWGISSMNKYSYQMLLDFALHS